MSPKWLFLPVANKETFVEEAPEERVMVGMLAEDRMEQSLTGDYVENNKTRFERNTFL